MAPRTSSFITMTTANVEALAARLIRRGSEERPLAESVAILEAEARLSGRLLKVMLRQVHSSDVFQVPPDDGGGR
jgi:hypothetical protein